MGVAHNWFLENRTTTLIEKLVEKKSHKTVVLYQVVGVHRFILVVHVWLRDARCNFSESPRIMLSSDINYMGWDTYRSQQLFWKKERHFFWLWVGLTSRNEPFFRFLCVSVFCVFLFLTLLIVYLSCVRSVLIYGRLITRGVRRCWVDENQMSIGEVLNTWTQPHNFWCQNMVHPCFTTHYTFLSNAHVHICMSKSTQLR